MAVTTKKTFSAADGSTKSFGPIEIELNNQDDLDVYVTLSGGTRRLSLRQSSDTTATSSHPQVNDTTGLYFPAVSVGDQLHNYSISTDNNNIVFNNNLPSGAVVSCERRTRDSSSNYTHFSGGSTIRSTDLNNAFDEANFTAQEARNKAFDIEGKIFGTGATGTAFISSDEIVDGTIVGGDISTDTITASNLAANSVGSSELADDAVDTNSIQDNAVTMGKLNSGALPTDITIASANIVDGTIVNADVSSSASIAHSKLSGISGGNVLLGNSSNVPTSTTLSGDVTVNSSGVTAITTGSIVTADIAGDQITNALIADNAIANENIQDGQVFRVHLVGDAVDSSKLADNAVNSEHIAAGAVDLEHMSANSVDSDQYVDGSVDRVHLEADIIDSTKLADNAVNSEHYVDGSIDHVHLANDIIDGDNIQDDVVNSEHIAAGALDNEHYAAGSITSDKLNAATVVTNSEQAAASANDTSFFTTSASDARYFNVSTGDTIKDGETFPDNDTTIATTAAINDRIIDLVDDVGGFVPIANELAFPNANPDVNNGAGTLVSIKTLSTNYTSSGSGVISISNGTVGNSTVTINGAENSTTYSSGYGMIVETTSTLNTYSFHRLVPKATEVTTVAGKATEIGRLGTAAAVEDMSILGTTDCVADMAILGTADVVSDLNTLATADIVSDMNTLATSANVTAMDNCSDDISNINTVAGSISNVNSVASNMSTVNDFAARYRTGANNPTDSLDTGDLFFNTSANELKVYNGSAWQGGVTASGNFASITGNTFTGDNLYNDNVKAKWGNGSDLQIHHASDASVNKIESGTNTLYIGADHVQLTNGAITEAYVKGVANGSVEIYYDGSKKLETISGGVLAHGNSYVNDGDKFIAGTSNDLQIFHSGVNSVIDNNTGGLYIRNNVAADVGGDIFIQAKSSENSAKFIHDGAVELYYDSSKKFETKAAGVEVTGQLINFTSGTAIALGDSSEAKFGSDADLSIYHDGNNAKIINKTGNLTLNATETEMGINIIPNGAVELYYDNTKHFETYASGSKNTGNLWLVTDNDKALFGAGTDLQISHDGTDNIINNHSADLHIKHGAEVQAKFINDGSVELYYDAALKFRTRGDGVNIYGHALFGDNNHAIFGADNDLKIYHSGSHGFILNGTGNLDLRSGEVGFYNYAGDETLAKFTANGAVELRYDNSVKLETMSGGISVQGQVAVAGSGVSLSLQDQGKLALGQSDDCKIYHSGSHAFIDNDTGNLNLQSPNNIYLLNDDGSENLLKATANGSVELYYDNSKKLETTSVGIRLSGNYQANDGYHIYLGTGNDLDIYHDGSASYIQDAGTGQLRIDSNAFEVMNAADSEYIIKTAENGGVELYYDNSKKLETRSDGVGITGILNMSSHIYLGDDDYLICGTSNDLQIYHDGTSSYVKDTTSDLYLQSTNDDIIVKAADDIWCQVQDGENAIVMVGNGAVELYYDADKRFETTSAGVKITSTGNTPYCDFTGASNNLLARIDGDAVSTGNAVVRFHVESGGTTSEKLRIQGGGGISFNGDTSADNALNDYEEGTWTPNPLFGSTDAGETALTGSGGLYGKYTKIGNLVYCHFSVNFSGRDANADGIFKIDGLPFAISANNWNEDGGTVHYYTGITSPASPPTILCENTNKIKMAQAGTAIRDNAVTDWNDQWSKNEVGQGTIRIRGSFTYHTAE